VNKQNGLKHSKCSSLDTTASELSRGLNVHIVEGVVECGAEGHMDC
jgi:hypothetical protein